MSSRDLTTFNHSTMLSTPPGRLYKSFITSPSPQLPATVPLPARPILDHLLSKRSIFRYLNFQKPVRFFLMSIRIWPLRYLHRVKDMSSTLPVKANTFRNIYKKLCEALQPDSAIAKITNKPSEISNAHNRNWFLIGTPNSLGNKGFSVFVCNLESLAFEGETLLCASQNSKNVIGAYHHA